MHLSSFLSFNKTFLLIKKKKKKKALSIWSAWFFFWWWGEVCLSFLENYLPGWNILLTIVFTSDRTVEWFCSIFFFFFFFRFNHWLRIYLKHIQGTSHSGPVLTPAEVMIAIHGIDPDRDEIPLKKACLLICFLHFKPYQKALIHNRLSLFMSRSQTHAMHVLSRGKYSPNKYLRRF